MYSSFSLKIDKTTQNPSEAPPAPGAEFLELKISSWVVRLIFKCVTPATGLLLALTRNERSHFNNFFYKFIRTLNANMLVGSPINICTYIYILIPTSRHIQFHDRQVFALGMQICIWIGTYRLQIQQPNKISIFKYGDIHFFIHQNMLNVF